ncbi:unnamed protein product [Cyprideis torosa]|uniref:Conserved oligomeric Golgi complex subunit 3 n=1 Tax=Cyprideis torosa TaxID=163714 RepID=A0A7R8ZLT7_9CRUS|nr:unnamed protein product [Cyprideis torosa]CAG0894022.1 unnamed protein product [Cyprideis torosa]
MSRFHHPSPRMRQNMVSSSTASSVQQAPISDASVLDRVTQWDPGASHCLAPLASSALESVELLKRTKVDRPRMHVPRQQVNSVSSDVDVLSSPSSPLCHLPATVVEGVFAHLESGEGKIETAQQFLTWYVEVEREMTDEEDAEFREFLRELQAQWEQCNGLMDEVDSCLRLLADLKDRHLSVTEKTDRLHSASENLVAEQASLSKRLALIETHLAPFITAQELEPRITSAMDAGMASLSMAVQGAAFIPMLQKLDESISHMVQHPNFKESGSYLTKLRHLQYQALAMIRAYVCHALRLAAEAAYQQRPESLDAAFPAFYGKFRSCAPRIKGFMAEMERRAKPGEDNAKLLADVHDMYFDFRDRLLRPLFTRRLNDLSASHQRDHCTVVRAGCNNLIRICLDEHDLYFQFFNEPSEAFLTFILNLGSVLYDLLRPIFLRMSHLETLSEVCSILRIEMIEEQVAENRESLAPFETLCLQMLQDVQERLVYVTHIYIRSDILGFQPSPGDLAYPQKLEMMKSIAESLPEGENPGGGRSPCDLHGMWYPTVRRTLVCLSKLFRCLDREAFQGLSQEALEMCIQSLLEGTKGIARRIDGHLFLIKHLLILREQIAPFQVEFAVKETSLDFGKVKDAALELFHKRRMLFSFNSNNALLEFLLDGTPQVKDKV